MSRILAVATLALLSASSVLAQQAGKSSECGEGKSCPSSKPCCSRTSSEALDHITPPKLTASIQSTANAVSVPFASVAAILSTRFLSTHAFLRPYATVETISSTISMAYSPIPNTSGMPQKQTGCRVDNRSSSKTMCSLRCPRQAKVASGHFLQVPRMCGTARSAHG